MSVNKVEVQDAQGNVYYPHTDASVVFRDSKSVGNLIPFELSHSRVGTVHKLTGTIPTTGIVTIRFKPTADFIEGDTFTMNGVAYTGQPSSGEETALPIKTFKSGISISCECDIDGKKLNFKNGGGKATSLLNFPITISQTLPPTGVAGQIHVIGDIANVDNIFIDDAVRLSHPNKSIILQVDDTNNGKTTLVEPKKISNKKVNTIYNQTPTNENYVPSWQVSKPEGTSLSAINQKPPMAVSKSSTGLIDVETLYQHNGTSWDMLSQKGAYMLQTFTTAPFVRLMYNNDGANFTEHTPLEGISEIAGYGQIYCIEVSPNNQWYIVGFYQPQGRHNVIWYRQGDVFTKIAIPTQISSPISSVGFKKGGTVISFGTMDSNVHLFSISGSTLTFVKTITRSSPITNLKFSNSKLVATSGSGIYTYDLINFNPIAVSSLPQETQGRSLELFTDSGKEYALVLGGTNGMSLCELGSSATKITAVSSIIAMYQYGIKMTLDTNYVVSSEIINGYPNLTLTKRNGITFSKLSAVQSNDYFTVDTNSNIYQSNKRKFAIENDKLVDKGTYNTPYPNADKLITISPSY